MHETRWWSIAVVATAAVLASLLPVVADTPWQLNVGLAAIGVYLAFWFALGARVADGSRGAVVVVVVTIAFTAAVSLAHPVFAFTQAIAFPLLWTRLESTRRAIVASIALALTVGVAMFLSQGATTGGLLSALLSEGLSLVFAIAFGLWITRIENRSSERQRLIDELRATQHQVAMLSQDAGVTSERERLAREIHDTIAQDLTGLVLLAQRASRELSAGDTASTAEQLAVLEQGARSALAETRALVASTAPADLDTGGIAAALHRLGQRYERETALRVTVQAEPAPDLSRDLEVVLLRCAQEGLANVRKHAGANAVQLTLAATAGAHTLTVADDGRGFDPTAEPGGFGLSGMRERLALVGGTLEITSGAAGTTLVVAL
jgi:signal transduction histidine kinase